MSAEQELEPDAVTPHGPEMAGLRQLLGAMSGEDMAEVTVLEAGVTAAERFETLHERIAELEATVERLEATASGPELSKREKHEAILNHAHEKYQGGTQAGVGLAYGEVMAAANCSRRYAYTLMEAIGAAYEWAEYDRSGNTHLLKIELADREWAAQVASIREAVGGGDGS